MGYPPYEVPEVDRNIDINEAIEIINRLFKDIYRGAVYDSTTPSTDVLPEGDTNFYFTEQKVVETIVETTGSGEIFTPGSVIFANATGLMTEDNINFFWDDINNRLGIGTATPSANLDLVGTYEATGAGSIAGTYSFTSGGLSMHTGTDLIFYSDAGSTVIANIDDTSGNLKFDMQNSADFWVDSNGGNIGLGTTAPLVPLHFETAAVGVNTRWTGGASAQHQWQSTNSSGVIEHIFMEWNSSEQGLIGFELGSTSARNMYFEVGSTYELLTLSRAEVVINESGNDTDFRVEWNTGDALTILGSDGTATATNTWAWTAGGIGMHSGTDLIFYSDAGSTVIGTFDDDSGDLDLTLANSAEFRISGGQLDVAGDLNIENTSNANIPVTLRAQDDNASGFRTNLARLYERTGGGSQYWDLKMNNSADFLWYDDDGDLVYAIKGATNRIGIGIDAPGAPLHLFSADTKPMIIEFDGTAGAAMEFINAQGGYFFGINGDEDYVIVPTTGVLTSPTARFDQAALTGSLVIESTEVVINDDGHDLDFRVEWDSGDALTIIGSDGTATATNTWTWTGGGIILDGVEDDVDIVMGDTQEHKIQVDRQDTRILIMDRCPRSYALMGVA